MFVNGNEDLVSKKTTDHQRLGLMDLSATICKKEETQHNDKKVNPVQITTFQCAETIKAAGKEENQDMYDEVSLLDLVARNLMHDHCR